jgi:hypothetical protein
MALPFIWAIGMMIASYAIQVLLTPKPEVPKPASLDEFDFPQVEEGTPQSVIFGDVWVQDWHVLWYGNLSTKDIKPGSAKK